MRAKRVIVYGVSAAVCLLSAFTNQGKGAALLLDIISIVLLFAMVFEATTVLEADLSASKPKSDDAATTR